METKVVVVDGVEVVVTFEHESWGIRGTMKAENADNVVNFSAAPDWRELVEWGELDEWWVNLARAAVEV